MLKSLRISAVFLAAFALLAHNAPAFAQDTPDDTPEDTPAPEEDPAVKQAEAKKLFDEGKALAAEKKIKEAIEKFEQAYEAFPDINLKVVIGEAYQLQGNETGDYENYKKAVELYKEYLEKVQDPPEATVTAVNGRIEKLEQAIEDDKRRKDKEAERLKQEKEEEARLKKEEEERKRKELDARKGMRPAIDAMVIAGIDTDTTAVARFLAGGFLGWGRFAIEGHLGFEGFLRINSDRGVSARSLTLIDLGVRYGLSDNNFRGLFVSAGGGFGLFGGKPREVKLHDDTETCPGFDTEMPGTCVFDVDKNISGRFGLGYGFAASKKTTVAVRLDLSYFLFSVDGEQGAGAVPAPRVIRPQDTFSILLGLEFMRWGS